MRLGSVDLLFLAANLILVIVTKQLQPKLRQILLLKDSRESVIFSIDKERVLWFILGFGIYIWGMEFLILNSNLILRGVTPILMELAIFSALIVTNLGYRKLGKGISLISLILFFISVVYFV
ncbi:hypothetical protein Halha_1263 [Halobacteroides halobius DSM 5150]|uniref:Uncharacterized protein n=1 Tax=Halobacteroides halobius (strain ATCC 35273 / DSM 5150 / MD-1) TaxID=748449 RepID=L0KA07_HALHC|nr:hypothetical protein [Halobacteroides halobius]AGB41209.1 hypothetical protein Halha_1263 [Halobacteroides halobius DSM 5150]